jgi:hypothetical protein
MKMKVKEKSMADQEEQVQTAIRVPKSWLERLDRIAEERTRADLRLLRADAFRMAMLAGIEVLEANGKKR